MVTCPQTMEPLAANRFVHMTSKLPSADSNDPLTEEQNDISIQLWWI